MPPLLSPDLNKLHHIKALLGDRLHRGLIGLGLAGAIGSLGLAVAAVRAETAPPPPVETASLVLTPALTPAPQAPRLVWEGADLDGDGAPDFANPTGHEPRGHDAYGDGAFHASRDGGHREHEGVDYIARAGQTVVAPVSGFVTHIGFAYPGDASLKYVEIENPALKITARVFYVDPDVQVGDAVALGKPIGHAHTLQHRYRNGITDHVHLEVADNAGRHLDSERLILAVRDDAGASVAAD